MSKARAGSRFRLLPADGAPRAQPPKTLVAVAGLAALVGCVMSVAGAVTTGISTDEPKHLVRMAKYLDSGMFVVADEIRATPTGRVPDKAFVYGPVTALLGHEVNRIAGNDDATRVSRTAAAYEVRHLVVAGIGIAGLAAAAALGWMLLGGWGWGVIVAGVLAAIPMWTGHAMFNPKDTPVATGHTLATLGLVLVLEGRRRARTIELVAGGLALVSGIVLMVGTRPGMWVALAVSLVVFLVAWVRTPGSPWPSLTVTVASLAASALALVAIYPAVFSHPVAALWRSATSSADFAHPWGTVGRWYQVSHLATEWPLILLGFLVVGLAGSVAWAVPLLRSRDRRAGALLLISAQAVAMPILVAVRGSHLYGGLRQLLFAVPAQAVLAAFGLALLIRISHGRWSRIGWPAVAAAGLLLPMAAQMALYPYQYAYLNVAGRLVGAPLASDYWHTSFREQLAHVSPSVKLICPHSFTVSGARIDPRESDCRTRGGQFSPFWEASGAPAHVNKSSTTFDVLLPAAVSVPADCHVTHVVTRWESFERVPMSRQARCHRAGTASPAANG
jgi:hypothetical protein